MKDDIFILLDPGARDAEFAREVFEKLNIQPQPRVYGRLLEFVLKSPAELQEVKHQLVSEGVELDGTVIIRWQRKYSPRDLLEAPLLRLINRRAEKGTGGPSHGTQYDFSDACKLCGTGAKQASRLKLGKVDFGRADLARTLDGDMLASRTLASAIEAEGITGVRLEPVEIRGRVDERWLQLRPTSVLPRMEPSSRGITTANQCTLCRRDGYYNSLREPEEIVYDASKVDADSLPDVAQTWEHFGRSIVLEPLTESHFASPLILVKPRVYSVFSRLRVRRVEFIPVVVGSE